LQTSNSETETTSLLTSLRETIATPFTPLIETIQCVVSDIQTNVGKSIDPPMAMLVSDAEADDTQLTCQEPIADINNVESHASDPTEVDAERVMELEKQPTVDSSEEVCLDH
jgi:hypothetical protein